MTHELRVLLAGESWFEWSMHMKGPAGHYAAGYGEGHQPLTEALIAAGHDVKHCPAHLAPTQFPSSMAELDAFDVVILSDISADALLLSPPVVNDGLRGINRLALLDEWVRAGGGMAMIGGYLSFSGFGGNAAYHLTPTADTLPVSMLGYDDRVEVPEGVDPECVVDHGILDGLPTTWPYLLGYNKLVPKQDAEVLVTVGAQDDPLLVVSEHGDGRVAAFASDCSPHWCPPSFVGWEHYGRLWTQLTMWLAGSAEYA